jgi:RNA polymerase-binding transcription factor DksA
MDHECYGYVDLSNIKNNEFIKCAECGKELGS